MSETTVLHASMIVTGEEVLHDAWLIIQDERVVDVGMGATPDRAVTHLDGVLIPGFVDLHVHGGAGGEFSTSQGIAKAIAYLRSRGTTTFMASLVSNHVSLLQRQIDDLLPFVDAGVMAGVHLEGPFLSPLRRGAHNLEALSHPDHSSVIALIDALAGRPAMITIAPELPGALHAIEHLAAAGVLVALGHSDASAEIAKLAVDAGARSTTHLFNAMRPMHHRDSGLAEWALIDSRLAVELILDGRHLSETTTRLALQSAPCRWIAVSDSAHVAGLPDGHYRLGDAPIELVAGVARLRGSETLAGSTACLADAFSLLIKHFQYPILEAVQATATRPAALLQRSDVGRLGSGTRADVVQWSGGAVRNVMYGGQWIRRGTEEDSEVTKGAGTV